MNKWSINKIIYFSYILPSLVGGLFIIVLYHYFSEQNAQRHINEKVRLLQTHISPSIEYATFLNSKELLEQQLTPLLADNDIVSVTVYNNDNQTLLRLVNTQQTSFGSKIVVKQDIGLIGQALNTTTLNLPSLAESESKMVLGELEIVLTLNSSFDNPFFIAAFGLIALIILVNIFMARILNSKIKQRFEPIIESIDLFAKGLFTTRIRRQPTAYLNEVIQKINSIGGILEDSKQQHEQDQAELKNIKRNLEVFEMRGFAFLKSVQLNLMNEAEQLARVVANIEKKSPAKGDIEQLEQKTSFLTEQLTILEKHSSVLLTRELAENTINIFSFLNEAMAASTKTALSNNTQIVFDTVSIERQLNILSDRFILSQVFESLLRHCVKYSPDGLIRVVCNIQDVDTNQSFLNISITDSGDVTSRLPTDKLLNPFGIQSIADKQDFMLGYDLTTTFRCITKLKGNIAIDTKEANGLAFLVQLPINIIY
ncbi:MAG: hypothetical protein V2I33_06585 [Kangiellaceae bacterium]|jgi:signal transduction histidine kinase|nr:hypothetical protein [Kangiellaceae bacterium]